jgi:hypothetical protein
LFARLDLGQLVLLLVCVFSFCIRLWLLDKRWIDPDEGPQSSVVKTEPLVTLLACVGFYGVTRFSVRGQCSWLVVAGMFAALGFYARQSAITIPVAMSAFILLFHGRRVREVVEHLGALLAGYGVVVLCVLSYYSRFLSLRQLWALSPIGWVVEEVVSAFGRSSGFVLLDPVIAKAYAASYWGFLYQAFFQRLFDSRIGMFVTGV